MVNLILVILSIVLTGATLFASLNYMPSWTNAASDSNLLVRQGFVTLEKAYLAVAAATGGVIPVPTSDVDGGLATNFSANYGFLPKPVKGYAWKYGYNGSDYYFCMYPISGAPIASEGVWKGLTRARQVLPNQQYFLLPGGAAACDNPAPHAATMTSAPTTYPALVSAVYLVRFVPEA